jgi:hypothetical protein
MKKGIAGRIGAFLECATVVGLVASATFGHSAVAGETAENALHATHAAKLAEQPAVAGASPRILLPEVEKVAYLGVGTQPPDESLSRQLGLINGTGLLVKHVDPDSPASGKLEIHDVLRTFDGQVLVNQEQLAVLVRTNKPGSTVAIELTRASKPVTVTVKLAEKEMPALIRSSTGTVLDPHILQFLGGTNSPVRIQMKRHSPGVGGTTFPGFGAGFRAVTSAHNGTTGTTTMNTGAHTFTLTTEGGSKTLRVTARDGEEVFNGPVNTDKERAKLPASLHDGLKELDNLTKGVHVQVAPQTE